MELPQQSTTSSPTSASNKCPYQEKPSTSWWNAGSWLKNGNISSSEQQQKHVPASIEESLNHPSVERIDKNQKHDLNTNRTTSSIPRGPAENKSDDIMSSEKVESKNQCPVCNIEPKTITPSHQPENSSKWVYPSEQQFYNAMIKKGHRPSSEDVPTILKIHNAVNEKSWTEVLNVEKALHPYNENSSPPQLLRFLGRPKDLSPKAFFNTYFLLYNPPFDRHDWYIARGGDNDKPRRYVIDFYKGNMDNGMYLDVRPAVDDFEGLQDRFRMLSRSVFPSIFEGHKKSDEHFGRSG